MFDYINRHVEEFLLVALAVIMALAIFVGVASQPNAAQAQALQWKVQVVQPSPGLQCAVLITNSQSVRQSNPISISCLRR
jgi:hypothetical protein